MNPEPYYASASWPDGSRTEAVRDSRAEAEAWLRAETARGEPMATAVIPQRQRDETQRSNQQRLAALHDPDTADWSGPLHAARVLCAADRRDRPELVDRTLAELDVDPELVEVAMAARIVATARHHSLGPAESLHLELADVRNHVGHVLATPVAATVAAEVDELRSRAYADPSWWASLWEHLDAILHNQTLAARGGVATLEGSPSITERLEVLEYR